MYALTRFGIALFLSSVMLCTAVAEEGSSPSIDGFLDQFQGERGRIDTFTAEFTQRTITEDEELDSNGRIVYSRPQRIRFQYSDLSLDFVLFGLTVYEFDPELEQIQLFNLEDRPETEALFLGFENDTERLQEAYDIDVRSHSDGGDGVELYLLPRSREGEESLFRSVTLQLRGGDFLPTSIIIENDETSSVIYALSNHQLNPVLSEDDLSIFLPEGTVVVEDERYVETVGPEGKRMPEPPAPLTIPADREEVVTTENLP